MNNRTARGGPVSSADSFNNGSVQARQAHFLSPNARGARHIIREPLGPLQDALFEPHQFAVMGHAGQAQVEICIGFSAVVVPLT